MKRSTVILISVALILIIGAGLGVLIWWLLQSNDLFEVIQLEGEGFGDVQHTAAFTRIPGAGDIFWLFYPSIAIGPTSRPIILWLDGITGVPPSLLANFGMFGPLDVNLNKRTDSWVEDYNLLFVDAPLGTGFSKAEDDSKISGNIENNADQLLYTVESFYNLHEEYVNTPLFIFGQGHGAKLALSLAIRLSETERFENNLKGVLIGNGIISPALVLTKLGFYLEELGYIDDKGRSATENLSNTINNYVDGGQLENAYDLFLSLGEFINTNASAVAINLNYLIDKLTKIPNRDYFGAKKYLEEKYRSKIDLYKFMDDVIAPIIGIPDGVIYNEQLNAATQAFKTSFMEPATDKVEYLLQNINVSITIYNGNLDAVSNTPGQLQWVENLQWPGQDNFLNSSRSTLIVNSLVEGYFRHTEKLRFYWMNAAGQSVPLDSPVAMRRVIQRILNN